MYIKRLILSYWHWTTKVIGILSLKKNPYFTLDFFQQLKQGKCVIFFFFSYSTTRFLLYSLWNSLTQSFLSSNSIQESCQSQTRGPASEKVWMSRTWNSYSGGSTRNCLTKNDQLNTAMVLMLSLAQWQVTYGIFSFMFSLLSS